jgi:hypothetical protein
MSDTRALRRNGVLAMLLFSTSACFLDQPTYDDCVLKLTSQGISDSALQTGESACRRKYEEAMSATLEIYFDADHPDSMTIKNPTNSIITQAEIIAPDGREWVQNVWLEPGQWEHVAFPTDKPEQFKKLLEQGKIQSKASKLIQLKKSWL